MDCNDKQVSEIIAAILQSQMGSTATDWLGLCIFGRSVTDTNTELVIDAINNVHDTAIEPSFFWELGRETLRLEYEFNKAAGFLAENDEIHQCVDDRWQQDA